MKWTKQDGTQVEISEMSTEHLKNTLAMLKRKGYVSPEEWEAHLAAAFSFSGEMSSYYAEQEADRMKVHAAIPALEKEYAKRLRS
jgi:hypothetical protein